MASAAKPHGQLALCHIHGFRHNPRLGGGVIAAGRFDLCCLAAAKCGERLQQGILHTALLRTAAIEQLHAALGQQALIMLIQFLIIDLLHCFFIAQTADTVGLVGTHLLQQTQLRPIALIVANRANGIDQVALFALHIGRQKAAAAGNRVQKQLAHQLSGRLQQTLTAKGKMIVYHRAHKTHTLGFAALADSGTDLCAVKAVHRRRKLLHIRAAHGAAVQHSRKQRVIACRILAQRRDQMCRETACFKLRRRQIC